MITLSDIPTRGASWLRPSFAIFLIALATAPWWIVAIGFYPYLGIELAIWILFAMGFNLLFGYAGLHSFGHGAYLGLGAYAFGLFQEHIALSLWGGLAAAILAAAIGGGVAAALLSHRRGIYYALMSIGIGQIFWFSAMKLHGVTGGEDGLVGIPRPPLELGVYSVDLNDNFAFYLFCAALLAVSMLFLWRLVNAPFGRVLQAIRQNETRARFLGYEVWRYKWAAFTLAAAFAGLAGGLLAMAQHSAYPDVMSVHQSGLIVMMVLIGGGLVSFWGPVFGVIVYFLARDVIGGLTETWLLWFGLLFMAMVMVRPEGVAGLLSTLSDWTRRPAATATAARLRAEAR